MSGNTVLEVLPPSVFCEKNKFLKMAAFDIFLEFRLLVDDEWVAAAVAHATSSVSITVDISIWQDILLTDGNDVDDDATVICAISFNLLLFLFISEFWLLVVCTEDIDAAKSGCCS